MSVPDLITDFPTSVSCSILSEWVSTVDLAKLDSAYCCNEKRGVVLDMFRSKEFHSKDNQRTYEIHRVSTQFWDWILRRDIKLFYVTVSTFRSDEQKLEGYAKRHERYIGHLDLAEVMSSSFALHCRHLVQLTCNMKVDPDFETLLQNNPNLEILDVHGLKEEHIESLKTIRLPHLTQMRLDVGVCSTELVASVLAMSARLLTLDLLYVNSDFTGVARHCPHLRSLSIRKRFYDGLEESSELNLAEFTSYVPNLVNLQLVDIIHLDDTMVHAVVLNLKQLRVLYIQFRDECNLTDSGIAHIAEHCAATLEVFGLRTWNSLTNITHVSLDLLCARCTKLRQFHVEAKFGRQSILLGSVTTLLVEDPCRDDTLVEISIECPKLEVLRLWGGATDCTLLVLRALCQKCHKLHRVEVLWDTIGFAYVKSLAATLPQLLVTDRCND